IERENGAASGVTTADGEQIPARAVLVATDPYRLPALLGDACPAALKEKIDDFATRSLGQTMKVNLALSDLPVFSALPEPKGQHSTTVHLMPPPAEDGSVLTALRQAFEAAEA